MIAVTTVHKAPPEVEAKARERAAFLGLPYCPRQPTFEAMENGDTEGFLVYGKRGRRCGRPVMSMSFIRARRNCAFSRWSGAAATGCAACSRRRRGPCWTVPSERKDSIVLSWYLGETGRVTALEKSAALWEIGQDGLAHFTDPDETVTAALRRVTLLRADFRDFLRHAADDAWDVIYFDTMFRRPVKREANNREAFRSGACYDRLDEAVLREAMRAARLRVIVKERPFSEVFRNGLFQEVHRRRG